MAQRAPASDYLSAKYAANEQIFIIPLTFANILDAKETITRISYGGDIWELRVDLLNPGGPLTAESGDNLPPADYVRQQVKSLKAMSVLPILFTIRTRSQGGRFPDAAAEEAMALWIIAVEEGVEYIDVEIEWPQATIEKMQTIKKHVNVVASYHSWTGQIRWTSSELQQKCAAVDAFGGTVDFHTPLLSSPTI
jgi:3-dehydroquinate dehydratase type I